MKGFIEVTHDGEKSIIATKLIDGFYRVPSWRDRPKGFEAASLKSIISMGKGAEMWVDETYEQLRDALEAAT